MARFERMIGGFRALFHKTRLEQEFDEEVRDFLETAIEHRMRSGASREAATRAARLELGGIESRSRSSGTGTWNAASIAIPQSSVKPSTSIVRRS